MPSRLIPIALPMLWLVWATSGCLIDTVVGQDIPPDWIDHDGDGWSERQGDCDDTSALVGPYEFFDDTCDGIDNNCDGAIDIGSDGESTCPPEALIAHWAP